MADDTYAAFAIAEAIVAELSQSPWELLAKAAVRLRGLTRFERGGGVSEAPSPLDALTQARALAGSGHATADNEDPFAPFRALHRATAASMLFAPVERDSSPLPALPAAFPHTAPMAPKTPLWALDLAAGPLLAHIAPGTPPLPLPGLVREEALAPQWHPRERAILIANALGACCAALDALLEAAYADSRALAPRLSGFRSTSHAPALALLLTGFGPLRPVQIERGFGLTRNGTHKLLKALIEVGLVESERVGGQILVRARRDATPLWRPRQRSGRTGSLPSPARLWQSLMRPWQTPTGCWEHRAPTAIRRPCAKMARRSSVRLLAGFPCLPAPQQSRPPCLPAMRHYWEEPEA